MYVIQKFLEDVFVWWSRFLFFTSFGDEIYADNNARQQDKPNDKHP